MTAVMDMPLSRPLTVADTDLHVAIAPLDVDLDDLVLPGVPR